MYFYFKQIYEFFEFSKFLKILNIRKYSIFFNFVVINDILRILLLLKLLALKTIWSFRNSWNCIFKFVQNNVKMKLFCSSNKVFTSLSSDFYIKSSSGTNELKPTKTRHKTANKRRFKNYSINVRVCVCTWTMNHLVDDVQHK